MICQHQSRHPDRSWRIMLSSNWRICWSSNRPIEKTFGQQGSHAEDHRKNCNS